MRRRRAPTLFDWNRKLALLCWYQLSPALTMSHIVQPHATNDRNILWSKNAQKFFNLQATRAWGNRERAVSHILLSEKGSSEAFLC